MKLVVLHGAENTGYNPPILVCSSIAKAIELVSKGIKKSYSSDITNVTVKEEDGHIAAYGDWGNVKNDFLDNHYYITYTNLDLKDD
jgi:hypothetical protein